MRADALFAAPAPNLLAWGCRGSYTFAARTVLPALTLPAHASMISGVPPARHRIYHDDVARGTIPVPTLLDAAHRAGKRVVVVVAKDKLLEIAPATSRSVFRVALTGADDVITTALAEVAAGFDVLFVHVADVDFVGHSRGWMSAAYLQEVAQVDGAIARLLHGLDAIASGATVLVTSDHGGSGYDHGWDVPEIMYIPWLVAGPGIVPARRVAGSVSTMDTAATLARVLGVTIAPDVVGQPVDEAFGGPARVTSATPAPQSPPP